MRHRRRRLRRNRRAVTWWLPRSIDAVMAGIARVRRQMVALYGEETAAAWCDEPKTPPKKTLTLKDVFDAVERGREASDGR